MKYLKRCKKETDYTAFKNSTDWVLPNISFIEETRVVKFNSQTNLTPPEPEIPDVPETPQPIALCDVVYWDGSKMQTSSWNAWEPKFGTPIGVVVIPEGFLPDGKARMIGLNPVNASGQPITSHLAIKWGPSGTDTRLPNYNMVPTTDNTDSISTTSDSYGYLPSDKFNGTQSYVDPLANYSNSYRDSLIPSPYLGDNGTFNPEYSKTIPSYNNMLSDFYGLSNTQTLVRLGTDYVAANAAWNYTDGLSKTQWYLPAIGELGFIITRINFINSTLSIIGGVPIEASNPFLSSSEASSDNVCYAYPSIGMVSSDGFKYGGTCVRPMAVVEL